MITTSADGHTFDQSWLLRAAGKAAPRYPARGKRPGYSDPKAAVFGDYLYLAYATGEEDIEVTRVPLAALISRTE